MKKFSFLIYHQDYDAFLSQLRELGLIHIVENKLKQEQHLTLEQFYAEHKHLCEAEKTLLKWVDKKNPVIEKTASLEKGKAIPAMIEALQDEKANLLQKQQVLRKERENLLPWGDFEIRNIERLTAAGYRIEFFVVQDSAFNTKWEDKHNAIIVSKAGGKTYFICLSKMADEPLAKTILIDPVKMPETSISQLNTLLIDIDKQIVNTNEEMKQLTADLPSLLLAKKTLHEHISYEKVVVSANKVAEDKIMHLQGWAPEDKAEDICQFLDNKNAYYQMADPTAEDDVPIKFKNNRFSSFFEPIAELYMLPKYNEIDLTPYFAPFYMIFFGLSLGDIGYGVFLFVAATIAKIAMKLKLDKTMKGIMSLVQILGISTMLTGLLTGGFFGANIYNIDSPLIHALKEKVFFDNNQMFTLSLILGVIQILFGMCLKVANRIKQFGFIYGLSTIGWVVLLLSFIASALFPHTLPMFGSLHLIILIPAAVLIYFFNTPGKNPFLNLGIGLWDTYNMATGLLGDILSYVRLFALGLSGGILASVFNSLAAGMSPDNAILGPIVYVLIFVIGHAITIFMNALGAIVHPVRLTFVEFYKNADFEGGGKKYVPFCTE